MGAANRIELLPPQAVTGSGATNAIPINTFISGIVGIDVTAVSGTTPRLDAYLQVSDDGGNTWYDMPYTLLTVTSAAASDVTASEKKRNIIDNLTSGTRKALAVFPELAADVCRLAWIISGTTPSFTFSASLVGK